MITITISVSSVMLKERIKPACFNKPSKDVQKARFEPYRGGAAKPRLLLHIS
uniref:Uncharacterized protein n=1 Tax=Anguilla anguilla TaxID=7936 RepID=A0A0E9WIP0_ANGAN